MFTFLSNLFRNKSQRPSANRARAQRRRFQPQIEALEDRQMLAANLTSMVADNPAHGLWQESSTGQTQEWYDSQTIHYVPMWPGPDGTMWTGKEQVTQDSQVLSSKDANNQHVDGYLISGNLGKLFNFTAGTHWVNNGQWVQVNGVSYPWRQFSFAFTIDIAPGEGLRVTTSGPVTFGGGSHALGAQRDALYSLYTITPGKVDVWVTAKMGDPAVAQLVTHTDTSPMASVDQVFANSDPSLPLVPFTLKIERIHAAQDIDLMVDSKAQDIRQNNQVDFSYQSSGLTGNIDVGVYRSAKPYFDSSAVFVAEHSFAAAAYASGTITIPHLADDSAHPYLLVVADPHGNIADSNQSSYDMLVDWVATWNDMALTTTFDGKSVAFNCDSYGIAAPYHVSLYASATDTLDLTTAQELDSQMVMDTVTNVFQTSGVFDVKKVHFDPAYPYLFVVANSHPDDGVVPTDRINVWNSSNPWLSLGIASHSNDKVRLNGWTPTSIPQPTIDANGNLQIVGTNSADIIHVCLKNGQVVVNTNAPGYSFPVASIKTIIVHAKGTNGNHVYIDSSISLPTQIYSGYSQFSSRGNNVLLGRFTSTGSDVAFESRFSSRGNNVLIGGSGLNFIDGGGNPGDVITGADGSITYDAWHPVIRGTRFTDIEQSGTNECSFIAALSALTLSGVDFTNWIQYKGNGDYLVRMYQPGNAQAPQIPSKLAPQQVHFDGQLIWQKDQNGNVNLMDAVSSNVKDMTKHRPLRGINNPDNLQSFWVTLFHRAYWQMNGYPVGKELPDGNTQTLTQVLKHFSPQGIQSPMPGVPGFVWCNKMHTVYVGFGKGYWPESRPIPLDDKYLGIIAHARNQNIPVIAKLHGDPVGMLDGGAYVSSFLVPSHCYTVLYVTGTDPNTATVTLRNPWGVDGRPSPPGDANAMDGIITISWHDFAKSVNSLAFAAFVPPIKPC